MTKPLPLKVGDRASCTNGRRIGTIVEIGNPKGPDVVNPQYHLESDDGWSWWSWRGNLRKLPARKEGA